MKKRKRWKEQVVSVLEIPPEIVLLSLRGKVTICGKNLEILWYHSFEMKIRGEISGIFPQKW